MKQKAIELRKQGLTYQAIADQLNLSLSTAYRYANVVVLPSDIERVKRQEYKQKEREARKQRNKIILAQRKEREEMSFQLRGEGMTFQEIGEKLGISTSTAYFDYCRAEENYWSDDDV